MKKLISLVLISFGLHSAAQVTSPPIIKNPFQTSGGLTISSRKDVLVEKEIVNLSKFHNLNFQKITLKDLSDDKVETSLGIMMEYETFDRISKKTLTIEKSELPKIIQSLETLTQQENNKIGDSQKKYKITLINNIEIGAVYKENMKTWVNYYIFPTEYYSHTVQEFSTNELKDLIKLLRSADKEL